MARMPNPSAVPMVGAGGQVRPEWVRFFTDMVSDIAAAQAAAALSPAPAPAPAPAPTPAPAVAVESIDQAPADTALAALVDELAGRVSALEQT